MTVRERVLISRLIQKTDANDNYAKQIGLHCVVPEVVSTKSNSESVYQEEKKH